MVEDSEACLIAHALRLVARTCEGEGEPGAWVCRIRGGVWLQQSSAVIQALWNTSLAVVAAAFCCLVCCRHLSWASGAELGTRHPHADRQGEKGRGRRRLPRRTGPDDALLQSVRAYWHVGRQPHSVACPPCTQDLRRGGQRRGRGRAASGQVRHKSRSSRPQQRDESVAAVRGAPTNVRSRSPPSAYTPTLHD
jgi:hypothetical protein